MGKGQSDFAEDQRCRFQGLISTNTYPGIAQVDGPSQDSTAAGCFIVEGRHYSDANVYRVVTSSPSSSFIGGCLHVRYINHLSGHVNWS